MLRGAVQMSAEEFFTASICLILAVAGIWWGTDVAVEFVGWLAEVW